MVSGRRPNPQTNGRAIGKDRGWRSGATRAGIRARGVGDSIIYLSLVMSETQTKTAQRWICESCGFIYDPADGDPDGGIPPGTPFEEIPDTWFCPVCGARKRDFAPYED